MIKNLALYGIGIYVIGLLLSGVTYFVLDFAPYFIAGMIVTMPIYGVIRQRTGKGANIQVGMNKIATVMKRSLKINKKSISAYLVVLIVVSRTHEALAEVLVQSVVVGIVTLALTFATWEVARYIANKAKKIQFLSFGEAIKGAF